MERYEKEIQAIVRNLKSEFYLWFGALAVLALIGFLFAPSIPKLAPDLTIALQSVLLILLLLGLPGIFIWFRNRMTANNRLEDLLKRLSNYEKYSRVRQFLFFLFGFLVLAMQVFTVMKGAYMLFLAVVVLSLFIIPTRGRLIMEADLLKTEEEEEKAEEDMGSE